MSIFLVVIPIAQDEKECNFYLFLSELFPLPPGFCLAVIKLCFTMTHAQPSIKKEGHMGLGVQSAPKCPCLFTKGARWAGSSCQAL